MAALKKETAIRNAFHNLLNDYAKQKGLLVVPEVTIKAPNGKKVTPDGTLKDMLRQDWGYWESKDESDDLDEEIRKKFDKGLCKWHKKSSYLTCNCLINKWTLLGTIQRPSDYESDALTN